MLKKRVDSIESSEALDKVQRLLASRAPTDAVCGEKYPSCGESASQEFHFCCAAHKICSPGQEAPLKFADFAKTLKHYGIKKNSKASRAAYDAYLVDVSIAENEEALNQQDEIISSLEDKLQSMDGTDSAEKSALIKQLNEACAMANEITSTVANKAASLMPPTWPTPACQTFE